MKKTVFIISFCLISFIGFGQLEINAELRPRGEVRHGYKNIPKEDTKRQLLSASEPGLIFIIHPSKFKVGFSYPGCKGMGR